MTGTAVNPTGPTGTTHPHPRYYGTFPRVLGRYVRELKVITLPEAIKKMTSMNADKIGIKDRGRLKPGMWADVTIFDPATVIDRATFQTWSCATLAKMRMSSSASMGWTVVT